jgi:Domain of unknown function (DUF1963)
MAIAGSIHSDNRASMTWGDAGSLYWLITPEDLEAQRFDRALFTWQCSQAYPNTDDRELLTSSVHTGRGRSGPPNIRLTAWSRCGAKPMSQLHAMALTWASTARNCTETTLKIKHLRSR